MDLSEEIASLDMGIEMQMQMNRSERRRQRRQQCCNCWKSFLAFLFSHIGLAAMVVAYSIMGGFLFQALEAPYELKVRYGIREWKEIQIDEIYTLAVHLTLKNIEKENFTERVRKIFLDFQANVTRHVKDNGWDGNDDMEEATLQWSFAGALLYAVTVITTIGYGHVAPKTIWGRLLTIVYALVGIPLTFLYLSNIGNFMADCFRLFYKNICCDLCCCQRCERKRKRERAIARRRKAAQRNSLLRQPSGDIGYQQDELDPECHSLRDEIPLAIEDIPPEEPSEDDRDGPQNQDDIEQAAGGTGEVLPPPYQATVTDETLPIRETAILDDNIDDEDDGIKETAILDSDTDDEDDKVKTTNKDPQTPQTPVIDWDNIENFADARETAILDDEEDDDEEGVFLPTTEALPAPALNGGASDDMDTIPLASATDEVNENENDSKKRKRSKSRSKSREKKEQKLAEKKKEKERKEKEKKEKERLKREKKEAEKKSKKSKRDRSKDKKVGSAKSQQALLMESMESSGIAQDDANDTLTKDSKHNSKTANKDSSKSNDKSKTSGENSIEDSKTSKNEENDEEDNACANGTDGCDVAKDKKHKKDSDKRKNSDKKKDNDKKKVKERPSSLKEKTRFDNKVTMLGKNARDKPTSRSLKEPPHSILKDRSPSRKGAEGLSPTATTPTTLFPLPHPTGIPVISPTAKEGKLSRGKSTKKSFKRKDAQKAMQRREIMKMLILEGARREMLKQQHKSSSAKRSFSAEDMNHLASTSSDLKTGGHYGSDESFVTAKSESFGQDDSPSSPDHTSEKLLPEGDSVVTTQPDAISLDQSPYDLFDLSKDSGALAYDDAFDFGDSEQQEKVTVPISICLIIIAGYIFGGSMLFALWEEWDYLTGSYFCFITLSTIGFGDIVPGTDVSDWGSHEKLVLCALWLAFGLSLLAMCFNLMQEEVKEKCKWVGQKLGLLSDDDDG